MTPEGLGMTPEGILEVTRGILEVTGGILGSPEGEGLRSKYTKKGRHFHVIPFIIE